tara:strand:+ start:19320 stop:19724 length:405 start_codon:yes stop_codon:yes gene_type:complete
MTPQTTSLPSVLVVEDEILIRIDVVDMIEDAGFRTYEADSADVAMSLMKQHSDIGILFTDVEMPGSMNGLDLAARVKDEWPLVTVIIASGKVGIEKSEMPDGATFLAKPYASSLVCKTLHDVSHPSGGGTEAAP